jgi:cytochrome P450
LCGFKAIRWYRRFFTDPVAALCRAYQSFGPVLPLGDVVARRRRRLRIAVLGPEYNRIVLGKSELFRTTGQMIVGPNGSALRRLRYGLTRMTGELHLQQRRLVLPPLQRNAVEAYGAQTAAIIDAYLSERRSGEIVDIWRMMRRLTLRIASALLFDLQNPAQAAALGGGIERLLDKNFSTGVWLMPLNLPGTPYRGLLKEAERLEKVILDLVKDNSDRGGNDLFTILIQACRENRAGMTPAVLVGQMTILLAASYETTTNALTWTLFLLAQHPGVMSDLLDELEGVLRQGLPTAELLGRMPFLDQVIKESMRILPPVPFTIRAAERSTELGGIDVSRGDRVICSHYVTHHMPELYPEPEMFRPQRWLALNRDQYEYMPFSAGPRACIGYSFAMQVMKMTLAMLLTRFRLTVLPGARIDRTVKITMSCKYGMPMILADQDRRFEKTPVSGNIHEMVSLG